MHGQRNPNRNPKTAVDRLSKKRVLFRFSLFVSSQNPAQLLSGLEGSSSLRIMRPLPRRFLHTLLHSSFLMGGSKYLPVRCCPAGAVLVSPHCLLHLDTHRRLVFQSLRSPNFKYLPSSLKSARFCSVGPVMLNKTGHLPKLDAKMVDTERLVRLKSKLEEVGINCGSCQPGQYSHMTCPQCKGGPSEEKSFSLFIREDLQLAKWSCFRAKCGWRGVAKAFGDVKACNLRSDEPLQVKEHRKFSERDLQLEPLCEGDVKAYNLRSDEPLQVKEHRKISERDLQLEPLCEELVAYFSERMISAETLRRNSVMQRKYNDQIVIAFTYRRNGTLVGCKYREVSKKFWQERETEKIFYGLDDIKEASDIIIVEGEMDKLSMEEAGYRNCVSVPDGAPAKVSEEIPNEKEDKKFQYLWTCKEYLEKASRIILATDADPPGQALAEEIGRRIGKERCWRVKWPKKNSTDVCKDANEVLMYLGPAALRKVVDNAELYPIRGLFTFGDFFHEIDAYYHCKYGFELGVSTGWKALDELYKVVPGELTVITGVPNSGKSEWIDALLCNINESHGWKFVLCSMENKVSDHARKLLEKHIKKPFFNARYGGSDERMSAEELEQGKEWLHDTFHLIRCEDDCLPSIKWVLTLAKAAVLRYGVHGLVIDPYNELDHQRRANQTETEYVSQMLTRIKRFAQHHSCHVWFVAHPRQLQNWGGGPPNMYDISGSAHFMNKCDNGIVIHRNRDEKAGPLNCVQVCVRKVRNKVIGKIGEAFLSYNRITGEFMDMDDQDQNK